MKRFLTAAAVFMLLSYTPAFAAGKQPAGAPVPPRIPEMSVAGRVTEISASVLKIERTLKGKTETMEFILSTPLVNIAVGDQIKVSYLIKEGRNALLRTAPAQKTAVKKTKKDQKPVVAKEGPQTK